jgi:AAA15 family ATPase/GTPase
MIKSFSIKNFRSIESLHIERFGHINLIVGKNNSGKSTVLDAIKTYASFADENVLFDIINSHDEYFILDENDPSLSPFSNLFFGRKFSKDVKIEFFETEDNPLTIESAFVEEVRIEESDRIFRLSYNDLLTQEAIDNADEIVRVLKVKQGDKEKNIFLEDERFRRRLRSIRHSSSRMNFKFITTSFIANEELADAWDKVALRDYANEVLKALRIIEPRIEAISFIDSESMTYKQIRSEVRRIPLVRLNNLDIPVPLKSMGDGIIRLFQLALRLFEARDGLLLIDEFENGLHYSVQEKAWEMIFNLSNLLNVQVFCTTHSWDCIESFSKVAIAMEDREGLLFRLGASNLSDSAGKTIATVFDESDLEILTQSQVEVR